MKKLIGILIVFSQMLSSVVYVSAANGDIAGKIYATDIKAVINGIEVPSYNIGGKTAVVIEDILEATHSYSYNDSTRTLRFYRLAPNYLKASETEKAETPGKIIGNIYETDIKTEIYGVELTSYNIGGKTAVAIEDLGKDNEFSEIGGKYIWDGNSRTISLEFMHEGSYGSILLKNKANMTVDINDDLTEGYVTFDKNPLTGGGSSRYNWPEWFENKEPDEKINAIIPLMADIDGQSELVGYHFYKTVEKDYWNTQGFTAFTYIYEDKFDSAAAQPEMPVPTREEVIEFYLSKGIYYEVERFDADDYSLLYMKAGTNHGATHTMLLVREDGSYHNYSDDFESVSLYGNIIFEDVRIDQENEKVYLHYDVDYVIDLKTGELSKLN